jgi:hypothetical protein
MTTITEDDARARRIAWWAARSPEDRARIATACDTTAEYIRLLVHGYDDRRPSVDMAKRLASASGLARKWWLPGVWG